MFKQQKRVGLALGGGAVRGLAHLGVLAVLEREEIPVHYLAGTSVGSLVGAMFCAGLSVAELEYIASHIGWRHMARPVRSRWAASTCTPARPAPSGRWRRNASWLRWASGWPS